MGALLLARVERVVFGALDAKAGAAISLYRMAEDPRLNHRIEVVGGVLEQRCGSILSDFFRELRARKSE
jgi:tRNA(adenine34) deaminase